MLLFNDTELLKFELTGKLGYDMGRKEDLILSSINIKHVYSRNFKKWPLKPDFSIYHTFAKLDFPYTEFSKIHIVNNFMEERLDFPKDDAAVLFTFCFELFHETPDNKQLMIKTVALFLAELQKYDYYFRFKYLEDTPIFKTDAKDFGNSINDLLNSTNKFDFLILK